MSAPPLRDRAFDHVRIDQLSYNDDRSREGFGAVPQVYGVDVGAGGNVGSVLPAVPGCAVAGGGEDGLAVAIEDSDPAIRISR